MWQPTLPGSHSSRKKVEEALKPPAPAQAEQAGAEDAQMDISKDDSREEASEAEAITKEKEEEEAQDEAKIKAKNYEEACRAKITAEEGTVSKEQAQAQKRPAAKLSPAPKAAGGQRVDRRVRKKA